MTTDELRRLLHAATPGPYQSDGCNVKAGRTPVAMRALASTEYDVEAQSRATMDMIAAAVNALPLLLDVVDAASSINIMYQDKTLDAALDALEDATCS